MCGQGNMCGQCATGVHGQCTANPQLATNMHGQHATNAHGQHTANMQLANTRPMHGQCTANTQVANMWPTHAIGNKHFATPKRLSSSRQYDVLYIKYTFKRGNKGVPIGPPMDDMNN